MTGRPDLAARLVVGLIGTEVADSEAAWITTYRPAGVILFRRNVRDATQLAELCGRLHDLLPESAEIMADHEGGPVSVLDAACGRPPAPWTLGRIDDPVLTRRVMRDAAQAARDLGVDRMLAPCTDVLTVADNPIIGARAFGDDPAHVARHVAAAVGGLVSVGMDCCLKHWPGHGGTHGDTHLDAVAPVTPDDPAPLRAGLAAGADAVMLGHLRTPGDAWPASVSPSAVARLRAEASAARLFTDDLTMGALRGPLSEITGVEIPGRGLCDPAELPLAWFEAVANGGGDTLLCRGIPWTAWPLDTGRLEPPRLGPDVDPPRFADVAPFVEPASWQTALARAAAPHLSVARGDLLCWRPGADHRWGTLDESDIRKARWRGGLQILDQLEGGDTDTRYGQLIVASHAPLDINGAADLYDRLLPTGCCVALGHPSLVASLVALLPTGWRLVAGHDLTAQVLTEFIASDEAS